MQIDKSIPTIELKYDAKVQNGQSLPEVLQMILDADRLSENEFAVFSDKRTMTTKVVTFFGALCVILKGFYGKVNSGLTLQRIENALGESFDSLAKAQEAYKLRENGDGKAYKLPDSDVLTEREVIKGIIESDNLAGSVYFDIAQRLAKETKALLEYDGGVSDSDAIKVLQIGVNRWLASSRNPHRVFALQNFVPDIVEDDETETATAPKGKRESVTV